MRSMSNEQHLRWVSGDHTGNARPMQRATIQVIRLATVSQGIDVFAQYLFSQPHTPREIPNVRSIKWDRSVDTDAATCELTLYNTKPLPLGTAATPDVFGHYDFDQPGYYTFNRGTTPVSASRWAHQPNEWQNLLVPDRLIRTYEGRGFDPLLSPEADPDMKQSGVWLIDDVSYEANGTITVRCRDAARLLIDQICLPPVVPKPRYPLHFIAYHNVDNPDIVTSSGGWVVPTHTADSGTPYYGANGKVYGHRPSDAFNTNTGDYWLSVGNGDPDAYYAFEYIEGSIPTGPVKAVEVRTWGGPYRMYVSVKVGGVWQGAATVPYGTRPPAAPNGANIKYVASATASYEGTTIVTLPNAIANATHVRVTFTNLYNSRLGDNPYRAGVRTFRVSSAVSSTSDGGTHVEGDYGDYSQIVKRLLAYGGFHWPKRTDQGYIKTSTGAKVVTAAPNDDSFLGQGRVWGDIEMSGTAGPSELGVEIFDKKPVMDGITYIRDILGFIFFVDEMGAAVFRSPNIWQIGNFVGDAAHGPAYVAGVDGLTTIDENTQLMTLAVTLSSRNQRERVFIANTSGLVGATAAGHTSNQGPFDANLRRVAGWTDQHFEDETMCQVMADLITLRQLFTYRTDRVTISGYSGIQVDDQIRIVEATTSEDFIHYVRGISSNWNIETGVWTYDLDTHWLGSSPYANWAFNPAYLAKETRDFLTAMGRI